MCGPRSFALNCFKFKKKSNNSHLSFKVPMNRSNISEKLISLTEEHGRFSCCDPFLVFHNFTSFLKFCIEFKKGVFLGMKDPFLLRR